MKLQKIFQFWLTTSAFWILFSLMLGGSRWKFPYPLKEAWEKQVKLSHEKWE